MCITKGDQDFRANNQGHSLTPYYINKIWYSKTWMEVYCLLKRKLISLSVTQDISTYKSNPSLVSSLIHSSLFTQMKYSQKHLKKKQENSCTCSWTHPYRMPEPVAGIIPKELTITCQITAHVKMQSYFTHLELLPTFYLLNKLQF